jgi:cellulose synthase/poly-beta-1,6-N-acetylglucosamine synthase-like glycosyltransferase
MYFISFIGLIWNLGLLLQSFLALSLFRKLKSETGNNCENIIHILIPIRNEDPSHLSECIEYFLSQRYLDKLTICLTEIDGDHKNYLPLMGLKMQNDNRLSYVTYNGAQGYKAEQVNVALDKVLHSKEPVLIGIYDIDSRPDARVFEFVKRNQIDIGQQPTIYNANLENLNFLALAGALHQTSWAVGFEMFNFLFPKNRLVYTVGHGLFISSDALRDSGLFDEKCITEDLMFGYKSSIAKRNFRVIPYYEHAKFVKSVGSFIPQSARWYTGELELIDRFPNWYKNFNGQLSDRKHYYLRLIELIWWPLERLLYIFTIIGAFIGLINVEFALLYTLVLLISGYMSVIVMIRNGDLNVRLLLAPILIPVWHSVSVLGPVVAIIKRMAGVPIGWTVTKK